MEEKISVDFGDLSYATSVKHEDAYLQLWQEDLGLKKVIISSNHCNYRNLSIDLEYDRNMLEINTYVVDAVAAYDGPYLGYGDPTRPLPEGKRKPAYDLLRRKHFFDLIDQKEQAVLLQIKSKTQTGNTKVVLSIKDQDELMGKLDINVEILALEYSLDDFSFEMWQYPYSTAEYYQVEPFSPAHFSLIKPSLKQYKNMGGSTITASILEDPWARQTFSDNEIHYPSMIKWEVNDQGEMTYDYTQFDQWVHFNKKLGLGDRIILYSMAPWHESFTYWNKGKLVYESYDINGALYEKRWRHFLEDLTQHLMDKDWFENCYIGIDERGFHPKPFSIIKRVKNIHAQSLKTAAAVDNIDQHYDLALSVDLLSVGDHVVKTKAARYQELYYQRRKKGLKTTLYSCTEHYPGNFLLSHPVESYWSIINAAHFSDGFLRWAFDAWVKDPLKDGTHNAFEPGDTFFIYPYNQPSYRLLMMQDALMDVHKLKTIAKQFPQQVDAVFEKLKFRAQIKRGKMSEIDLHNLIVEISQFKQDLVHLSFHYLENIEDKSHKQLLNDKMIPNQLETIKLDDKYLTVIEKKPNTKRQYLGQPDLVLTQTNRLISVYPQGHGKGPLIMQISDDEGSTWREYFDKPISWQGSQETPTLYSLKFLNGKEKIILISGCPGWGKDLSGSSYGFNTSLSSDDGDTWSEFKNWYQQIEGKDNPTIVAMSSLIQLKDSEGRDEERWLGIYHDYEYRNYKTILTFDQDGNEHWSQPEALIPEYRSLEEKYKMCEIGLLRKPDDHQIIAIARSQSHRDPSTIMISKDEGLTWSKPRYLPNSLAGERHKLIYNKKLDNVMISFREIIYDVDGKLPINEQTDWIAGDWILWVGTFSDLLEGKQGSYRILLKEDFTPSLKMGDTGYAGIVVLKDGTCLLHGYGHWDQSFSSQWEKGVTRDLCYIVQAKFK